MAVAVLALHPALAQHLQRSQSSVQTVHLSATELSAQGPGPAPSGMVTLPENRPMANAQTGNFAAAIVRILAARNMMELGIASPADMDAFLRYPEEDAPGTAVVLLNRARKLYEIYNSATTFTSNRYDLKVDPLGMRCRLRISFHQAFSGGSN